MFQKIDRKLIILQTIDIIREIKLLILSNPKANLTKMQALSILSIFSLNSEAKPTLDEAGEKERKPSLEDSLQNNKIRSWNGENLYLRE